MLEELKNVIKNFKDPRDVHGKRHPFEPLMLMMLLGVACGYSGYRPLHGFMKANQEFFKAEFQLMFGIPSHVALKNLILQMDKDETLKEFNKWLSEKRELQPYDWVSGDGKKLRSTISHANDSKQNFLSVVSLFVKASGLCIHMEAYQNKKSVEIHVLQGMLEHLRNTGVIVTLDALHCQKKQ